MFYISCVYTVEFRQEVRELCSEVNPEQITQLCDFLTEAGLNRDNPKLLKTDLESLIHIINDQGYDWIAIKNLLGQIAKASLSSNDYNALEACYQDCMSSNSNLENLINLIKTEFSGFQSTLQRLHQKAENNIKDLDLIAGGTNSGKTNASNSWKINHNRTGKQKAKAIGIDVGEVLLAGSIINWTFSQVHDSRAASKIAGTHINGKELGYRPEFRSNGEFFGGEFRAVKRLGRIPDLSYKLSFGNRLKYMATKIIPLGYAYRWSRGIDKKREIMPNRQAEWDALKVDDMVSSRMSSISSYSRHSSIDIDIQSIKAEFESSDHNMSLFQEEIDALEELYGESPDSDIKSIQDDLEKVNAEVESSDIDIRRLTHKFENTGIFNELANSRINHKSVGKLPRFQKLIDSDFSPDELRLFNPSEIKEIVNGSDFEENIEKNVEKGFLNVLDDDVIAVEKAEGDIISDLE